MLYPSLQHNHSARLCADLVRDCPAEFTNIDVQTAAVFIAANVSRTEVVKSGLGKIVPRRRFKRGPSPSGATKELNTKDNDEELTKFQSVRSDLSEGEVRMLLAKVIEVSVLLVIRNHVYSWKNEDWMQTLGVPTGLRLSGLIGRITMDSWMEQMTSKMEDNNMKQYLFKKYMDDSEIILENLEVGSRWDNNKKKIVVTDHDAEEDVRNNTTREEITMKGMGQHGFDDSPWSLVYCGPFCQPPQWESPSS